MLKHRKAWAGLTIIMGLLLESTDLDLIFAFLLCIQCCNNGCFKEFYFFNLRTPSPPAREKVGTSHIAKLELVFMYDTPDYTPLVHLM